MNEISFDNFVYKYRYQILLLLIGILLMGFGILKSNNNDTNSVVILDNDAGIENSNVNEIVVEIAGAVVSPGVYTLESGSRVNDLIQLAGGLKDEDRDWVERFINRASILTDGQKIIIPNIDYQSNIESDTNLTGSNGYILGDASTAGEYININTATQKELESLWGIGPVYAQKIIEQRPYSDIRELVDKNIIKANVYERNKDLLTVY